MLGSGFMSENGRFMKAAVAAVVLSFGSLGCLQAQEAYNVALDGTFAPHAMPKLDGGIEGFNVDLTNEIGRRLGVEMNITPAQFSGLLPALQAGTYDFIVAPTTITPERAENLLFSEGYLDTDYQFVVPAGAEDVTDLKQFEGKTIAVNKGSAYDSWARELADEIGWQVESYGTNTDAVQAVISGRADANVAGNTVSAWAVKQNPRLQLSYLHKTGLVWGMPFRKDDIELRNKIERVIECMKHDGTVAELSEKWFGVTPAADSAAVAVMPGYGQPGFPGHDPEEHQLDCG
jgi:polar amino acid transport system substrate-binding protein